MLLHNSGNTMDGALNEIGFEWLSVSQTTSAYIEEEEEVEEEYFA